MSRGFATVGFIVLLSATLFGQSTEKPLAFEVADVHATPLSAVGQMSGGVLRDGRYEIRNATMVDLVRTAYGVDADKVLGGPSWLETTRFNVITRTPAGATPDTAKVMLKNLLAERFSLKAHDDNKPLPVFVLSLGSGKHKLKPSEGGPSTCQGQPQTPQPGTVPYQVAACKNMTADQIAQNLRQMAGGYFDKPLINQTKLDGNWDFEVKWTARALLGAAGADAISMFEAVDKQLGLKVEQQPVATAVIVVDSVNQKPTDNAPGVGQAIVAEKPEFETAEIKPSPPGTTGIGIRYTQGGRIDAQGTLKQLIGISQEILPNLTNDMIAGGPKYIDTEHYQIVAKAPSSGIGAPNRAGGQEQAPPLQVALMMLRALLEDRFKLKTHQEERPTTVYAVLGTRNESKLKRADPLTRASCRPDPAAVQAAKITVPMQAITCQNTTIAELARNLSQIAGGYIDHPVLDKTGLEGGWDFTLMWSPRQALDQAAPRPADAGGLGAAVDPGGYSVFEGLEKHLGLKLEKQTHPFPVIVIDSMEQKPID